MVGADARPDTAADRGDSVADEVVVKRDRKSLVPAALTHAFSVVQAMERTRING
jgi:hypothetical protein